MNDESGTDVPTARSGAGKGVLMRRKDREITDYKAMLEVLSACGVCHLGLAETVDGVQIPYVVPVNFGYEDADGQLILYFHGASAGKKMDLIAKNDGMAGFEADTDHELVSGDAACDYSWKYHSVIGAGKIEVLKEFDDKVHGLKRIMFQYAGEHGTQMPMDEKCVSAVCVLKMTVTQWTCKGY